MKLDCRVQNTGLKNPRALQMFVWHRGQALAQSAFWQLPVPESRSHACTKYLCFLDLPSDICLAKLFIISLVLVLECYCCTHITVDLLASSYRKYSWYKGVKILLKYYTNVWVFEYFCNIPVKNWHCSVYLCYFATEVKEQISLQGQRNRSCEVLMSEPSCADGIHHKWSWQYGLP